MISYHKHNQSMINGLLINFTPGIITVMKLNLFIQSAVVPGMRLIVLSKVTDGQTEGDWRVGVNYQVWYPMWYMSQILDDCFGFCAGSGTPLKDTVGMLGVCPPTLHLCLPRLPCGDYSLSNTDKIPQMYVWMFWLQQSAFCEFCRVIYCLFSDREECKQCRDRQASLRFSGSRQPCVCAFIR